jgi:hypothetical protein
MGQASPEVVARANLASGDVTLHRDWMGNVDTSRTMAPLAGMYGAQQKAVGDSSQPYLLSQAAAQQAALAELQSRRASATTPEQIAAIDQQANEIMSRPFAVPQGQTPGQFIQGTLGNNAAPVGQAPMVIPRTAPVAPTGTPADESGMNRRVGDMERSGDPEQVRVAQQYRETQRKLDTAQQKVTQLERLKMLRNILTLGIAPATEYAQGWLSGK